MSWLFSRALVVEFSEAISLDGEPLLMGRGLAVVIGDIAKMGYDAQWSCISASEVGAPHKRDRIWIVATNANGYGLEGRNYIDQERHRRAQTRSVQGLDQMCSWTDVSDPRAFGSNDGVAARVDRLKAIGNGQVPRVAATAFTILSK